MADLERFRDAQAPIYDQALAELRAGHKKSHWMWFVFPQIEGLGQSPMSRRYAISGLEEARAYLADEMLGPRLIECTMAMLGHSQKSGRDGAQASANASARAILGHPDDMKFRSAMTLFHRADPDESAFMDALAAFFDGREDAETVRRLGP